MINEALALAGGKQKEAAALLKMPLRTFTQKLKTFGIEKSYR